MLDAKLLKSNYVFVDASNQFKILIGKNVPLIAPQVTSSDHHEKQEEKTMVPAGSSWKNANKGFLSGCFMSPSVPETAMVVGGEMVLHMGEARKDRFSQNGRGFSIAKAIFISHTGL